VVFIGLFVDTTRSGCTEPLTSPWDHVPMPPSAPDATHSWWRDAVIYQVYPRSFADSDGDGVGDLRGVLERLDHVVALGADAIWLTPFYRSPQIDGGYDVEDHRSVDERFGRLEDVDELLRAAHAHGLRVLIDLVPNHTSDRHHWFRSALAARPGSSDRARYLFRPGRSGGALPPNDWQSVFGGPAWHRVHDVTGAVHDEDQWYLHLFAPEQPDLDWTNPEVRAEFESILRFWLDRGVDGFRVDVAHGLAKDPEMPDLAGRYETAGLAAVGHPHWDRDEVHDVYRSWRSVIEEYSGERIFVAEAYLESPERLAAYVRDDELHTAFNFRFLMAPWVATALRSAIEQTLAQHRRVGAPATWVLSNHDVVRPPTRYGGGELGERRARAAALLMFALPGAAYVYQGEELALPEVEDLPEAARRDPTFERTGGAEPGRDGCRVPLPWEGTSSPFGFGRGAPPWLPQPADWADRSVAAQLEDAASCLWLYRRAIEWRRRVRAADTSASELTWRDLGTDALAFDRPGGFTNVTNLGTAPLSVPAEFGRLVLSSSGRASGPGAATHTGSPAPVPPDTTNWYLRT
jgi:alpha-glucosidase